MGSEGSYGVLGGSLWGSEGPDGVLGVPTGSVVPYGV